MKYKFLRLVDGKIKSNSGNVTWEIGKWKKMRGEVDICNRGFHCSSEIYQAFSYVQGEVLAQVEVAGKSEKQEDKEVWSQMKLVNAWKWQKKDSVALAIYAAELVLDIFEKYDSKDKRPREAIEAAKKYLKYPIDKNSYAADAAAYAARAAADAAAYAADAIASTRQEVLDEVIEMVNGMKEDIDFSLPDGYDQPPEQRAQDMAEMAKYESQQNAHNATCDSFIQKLEEMKGK
jgi:hypothetical protein